MAPVTLVLGGAKSGKSHYAETRVLRSDLTPIYLATAQAFDDEMRTRIARHRQQRAGRGWHTVEEPHDLTATLRDKARPSCMVLVDCLTLWLTNRLLAEADVVTEIDRLAASLASLVGPVVLVSNEVGQGVVPDNALARRFVDLAGLCHQKISERADHVVFVTAGLPQALKGDA